MIRIIKTTLKLLFRNVGFWLCAICFPVLATVMLNIQTENQSYYYSYNVDMGVVELESKDEKVAYFASDSKCVVKVYDASQSELCDHMLDKIARAGIFKVGRSKNGEMTQADADKKVLEDGQDDRMGAAVYIDRDFDKHVKNGEYDKALTVYVMSEDERVELLEEKLLYIMQKMHAAATVSERTGKTTAELLLDMDEAAPQKTVRMLSGNDEKNLTKAQTDQKSNLGYAYVFMTLGYILTGVILASTIIKELSNDVIKRIRLAGTSDITYFGAKFVSGVVISLILSVVFSICTLFIDQDRIGLDRISLCVMTFLLGLIFCTFTLFSGVLVGNIMGATVTAFTVWCLSSMISGLYFPIGGTSRFIQSLSAIMPQKWFMDGTVMLFLRDKGAWTVILCVTAAYMVVFTGLGSVGLKLRNSDD
ncbi:MAG: ABC transporter permease [Lachnospiraceae bacterium]|nr:ABC transporter permease [Lachnospiraceae bacterium]